MPFDSTGMTWKDSPTHVYVNVPMTKEALKAMNLRAFTDGDNLTLTTDDGVLVQSPPSLHRRVARVVRGSLTVSARAAPSPLVLSSPRAPDGARQIGRRDVLPPPEEGAFASFRD